MKRSSVLTGAWGIGWALLYLGTLTSRYAYDGVAYCGEIVLALARGSLREVVHLNHLLFHPLALAVVTATGGASAELGVHVRLQVLQALLGAATMVGLLLVLRRRVAPPVAAASASVVGLSFAFWHFATDVEVYTLGALTLVAALASALTASEEPRPGAAALAGVAGAVAVLAHATYAVFALATGLLLMLWAPGRRLRIGIAFALGLAGTLAGVVAPIVLGPLGAGRPEGRWGLLLGYMQSGSREGLLGWPWRDLPGGLATVAHGVVASPPGWAVMTLVPAFLVVAAAALILARRTDLRAWRAAVLAFAWVVPIGLFHLSWDFNEKYWIAAMVPGALLLAVACDAGLRRLAVGWRAAPVIALAVGLLVANVPTIRRDMVPANNRFLLVAEALRAATPAGSQVVLSGLDPWRELKVYVPYFAERTPVILDFTLTPANRGGLAALFERVAAGTGPPTYALGELLESEGPRAQLEARHGLPPGSLTARLRALCPRPVQPLPGGERLYILGPCPTPPSGR